MYLQYLLAGHCKHSSTVASLQVSLVVKVPFGQKIGLTVAEIFNYR